MKHIGTSRLNIETDDKSGFNFSNINISEDWLNMQTLSYDETFANNVMDVFNQDVLLDIFTMKHPETQKNGIFITSSSLQDTLNQNKLRDRDIASENYELKKIIKKLNKKIEDAKSKL